MHLQQRGHTALKEKARRLSSQLSPDPWDLVGGQSLSPLGLSFLPCKRRSVARCVKGLSKSFIDSFLLSEHRGHGGFTEQSKILVLLAFVLLPTQAALTSSNLCYRPGPSALIRHCLVSCEYNWPADSIMNLRGAEPRNSPVLHSP